jgi:hypothetical protein
MYSVSDAIGAMFQFYLDQGYDECQINQPSSHNFDDDDGYHFVHRDGDGEIDFEVQFNDDDGNATVTFANGESGDVNIKEDEDEDD